MLQPELSKSFLYHTQHRKPHLTKKRPSEKLFFRKTNFHITFYHLRAGEKLISCAPSAWQQEFTRTSPSSLDRTAEGAWPSPQLAWYKFSIIYISTSFRFHFTCSRWWRKMKKKCSLISKVLSEKVFNKMRKMYFNKKNIWNCSHSKTHFTTSF